MDFSTDNLDTYTAYASNPDGDDNSIHGNDPGAVNNGTIGGGILPTANYVDNHLNIPLRVIHPKPDGGTGKQTVNSWARHRWAHSEFIYRIKVSVQGGAPPYRYTLVGSAGTNYPTDMTIGFDYTDTQFGGILQWTPAAEAQNTSWAVTVRVMDQTGRYVDVLWTLELDDTKFIFTDSTVAAGGTGVWADPYNNMLEWYGSTYNDVSPEQGKISVYRAGTHTVQKSPTIKGGDPTNLIYFDRGSEKPHSHIGVPGEAVIWSFATNLIHATTSLSTTTTGYNFYLSDITMDGSPSTSTDVRLFKVSAAGSQFHASNIHFQNMSAGTVGNNNEAGFYVDGDSGGREDVSFNNLTSDSLPPAGDAVNGISIIIGYSCKYVVFENGGDTNSTAPRWLYWKASMEYCTTRYCTLRTNTATVRGILDYYNGVFSQIPTHMEVCYNNIKHNDLTSSCLNFNQRNIDNVGLGWAFRNTFEGFSDFSKDPADDNIEYWRNVQISTATIDSSYTIPGGEDNVHETTAAGTVDANGLLEAAYLTTNSMVRGTHGHEFST